QVECRSQAWRCGVMREKATHGDREEAGTGRLRLALRLARFALTARKQCSQPGVDERGPLRGRVRPLAPSSLHAEPHCRERPDRARGREAGRMTKELGWQVMSAVIGETRRETRNATGLSGLIASQFGI
ncbi:hypothetical protein THAOC_37623, partial [Thalassiosira oceanica]